MWIQGSGKEGKAHHRPDTGDRCQNGPRVQVWSIQGAINITHDEIGKRIGAVADDKGKHIVLYCRSGRRSGIALKTLREIGYSEVENADGFKEFKRWLSE